MKSKKSSLFFMPIVVVIVLIALVNLYLVLYQKDEPFNNNPIGKRQFDILKAVTRAESALLYLDQSAKYSLQQSVYELAKNGGVSEIEITDAENFAEYNCGRFDGAYVWLQFLKSDSGYIWNSCFDEKDAATSLQYAFNKNLNQYLLNYPNNIPLDNYKYSIKDSLELIGIALSPVKFDIYEKPVDEKAKMENELKNPSIVAESASKTPEGLRDFTGTALCAKGSRCVLTEQALKMLVEAQQEAAKNGVSIEAYSAYRSKTKQEAIWNGNTPENYADRYKDTAVRRRYVCDPTGSDAEKRCPHLTGNTVDIRLKGKTTNTMTGSDWNLLYKIMTQKGTDGNPMWVKYSPEPWHFECCNTQRYERAMQQGVTILV